MGCCFGAVEDPVPERVETDTEPGFLAAAMAFARYCLHPHGLGGASIGPCDGEHDDEHEAFELLEIGDVGALEIEASCLGVPEQACDTPPLSVVVEACFGSGRLVATISHSPLPRRLAARRRGSRVARAVPLMCPTRVAHRVRLRRKSVASDHERPSPRVTVMSTLTRMAKGILFSFRKSIHSAPMNSPSASRQRIEAAGNRMR